MTNTTVMKVPQLRYNEYYNMQDTFDDLYSKSTRNYSFTQLYELITSDNNIRLAYRNIKRNTGSNTKGTDGQTIRDIEKLNINGIVHQVRKRLMNYKPDSVRRVEIPKENGKVRPLGIPTILDRLIQQCFKQILEPICEAKFHKHSYGFRPNRSAENAVFRMQHLINHAKLYYCIDIDIKGFFDNIDHGKLLKQLWTIGIRDKKVISIIGKMLKAEIEGVGVPTKGTPQGGILSPLLANVVLNELDWWISSQWETMKTRNAYVNNNQYRALKTTNLKEVFIVRYADDFKLMCRTKRTAEVVFESTKKWLHERLRLDVSEEKSKITNLKKHASEFLGFTLKATKKSKVKTDSRGSKTNVSYYSVESHVSAKAIKNVTNKLKQKIKGLQKDLSHGNVGDYNSTILGVQNYYQIATHVSADFKKIDYQVRRTFYNRLKNHIGTIQKQNVGKMYKDKYGKYKGKIQVLSGIAIFPVYGVNNHYPMAFKQEINNYTEHGRSIIHSVLGKTIESEIRYLLRYPLLNESIELNDNRISKYSNQKGMCAITGDKLDVNNFDVHHVKMKSQGGTDKYSNLICISKIAHYLIHAVDVDVIRKHLQFLNPTKEILDKINKYRGLVGNQLIE